MISKRMVLPLVSNSQERLPVKLESVHAQIQSELLSFVDPYRALRQEVIR